MSVLVLGHADVRSLLGMRECIDALEEAFRAVGLGRARQPLRPVYPVAGGEAFLGLMPSEADAPHVLGLKAITVYPGNHALGLESHQGLVLLFDGDTGVPQAILDAASITAVRTAAASGLATQLLARHDAGDLAILGAGIQAASHLEAMAAVRKLRRVRVWSRKTESVDRLIETIGERPGPRIEPVADVRETLDGADLVCTVTGAREPILESGWVADGAHINAVGACTAQTRELDTATVARARVWVDSMESALHEAGDLLIPMGEGALDEDHIEGELGGLVLDPLSGRRAPEELTIFESLGVGIEDLAAAALVVQKARAANAGVLVDL